jgi:hypothetical protein
MNVTSALSILPSNLTLLMIAVLLVTGVLVFYALRTKGDVRAEVSHGRTVFKLEAKERKGANKVKTKASNL